MKQYVLLSQCIQYKAVILEHINLPLLRKKYCKEILCLPTLPKLLSSQAGSVFYESLLGCFTVIKVTHQCFAFPVYLMKCCDIRTNQFFLCLEKKYCKGILYLLALSKVLGNQAGSVFFESLFGCFAVLKQCFNFPVYLI